MESGVGLLTQTARVQTNRRRERSCDGPLGRGGGGTRGLMPFEIRLKCGGRIYTRHPATGAQGQLYKLDPVDKQKILRQRGDLHSCLLLSDDRIRPYDSERST